MAKRSLVAVPHFDTPLEQVLTSRDVPSRVLGFANSNADQLGPQIGEDGIGEAVPKTCEFCKAWRRPFVRREAAISSVVSEARCCTARHSAGGNDYAHNDQSQDG